MRKWLTRLLAQWIERMSDETVMRIADEVIDALEEMARKTDTPLDDAIIAKIRAGLNVPDGDD